MKDTECKSEKGETKNKMYDVSKSDVSSEIASSLASINQTKAFIPEALFLSFVSYIDLILCKKTDKDLLKLIEDKNPSFEALIDKNDIIKKV